MTTSPGTTSLAALAAVFLRLGATAFGGPAAHIALMHDEVVRRRRWLDERDFLDLLGAVNLIPGPNSTELAIHIGHRRGGFLGLVVAGVCFIVPAMLITAAFAAAYVRYGALPSATFVMHGIKPVVLAVVARAVLDLARRAASSDGLRLLGLLAIGASFAGVHELLVLLVAGLVVVAARRRWRLGAAGLGVLWPGAAPAAAAAAALAPGATGLFLVFAKIGATLFGSGYVLLAYLRADFVERLGWLTEAQLVDAVAVGQFTPGPLFTTATFVGYVVAGPLGALAATIGIFLPAFVLVLISGPLLPRLRASRAVGAFLDGVNVASLALMVVVAVQLGRAAIVDVPTAGLTVLAAVLLVRWKVNPAWLVLGGAAAGFGLGCLQG
ncbi:MAG: chromate efflux transporter [Planctomycetes bacterium]|nr:chromate efflux transporter [Planctomycetota bacterium]